MAHECHNGNHHIVVQRPLPVIVSAHDHVTWCTYCRQIILHCLECTYNETVQSPHNSCRCDCQGQRAIDEKPSTSTERVICFVLCLQLQYARVRNSRKLSLCTTSPLLRPVIMSALSYADAWGYMQVCWIKVCSLAQLCSLLSPSQSETSGSL